MSSHSSNRDEKEARARDPEETTQERARMDIMDEARAVRDSRRMLSDPTHPVSWEKRQMAMYREVSNFAVELRALMRADENAVGERCLYEVELGEIRLDPPAEASEFFDNNLTQLVPGTERPEGVAQKVVGLEQFRELEPVLAHTWTFQRRSKRGFDTETFSASTPVPWKMSERAYMACRQFMSDVGMGVEIEEQDKKWEI